MASLVSPSAAVPGIILNGHHAQPQASTSTSSSSQPHTSESSLELDTVDDAIEAIRKGEFVVVMDDLARENEGDLIIAASLVTTERMAWMIRHTRFVPPLSLHHIV